jgi:hypothetical protein
MQGDRLAGEPMRRPGQPAPDDLAVRDADQRLEALVLGVDVRRRVVAEGLADVIP